MAGRGAQLVVAALQNASGRIMPARPPRSTAAKPGSLVALNGFDDRLDFAGIKALHHRPTPRPMWAFARLLFFLTRSIALNAVGAYLINLRDAGYAINVLGRRRLTSM